MTWEEITHPDDLALDVAQFDRVMRGEAEGYSLEKRWVRKNGQIIHSAISVKGVRDENGVVNYLMKFVQDITKRKQAEEQLLYQANLLQNVSDAIVATDRHFIITGWNPAAENIYGWSPEEAIGRGVAELLDTQYMDDETSGILQQFLDEGVWQGEVTQKHKNGSTLNILSSVTFIKDKSDNLVGVVASNRNITEHKEAEMAHALLEAQLQQAQKMESIGQLASGVAHDFNNMLTVIQMYSELIRSKLPADHPLIEKIELIRSASQRSSALTRQLLAFSRKQILEPKVQSSLEDALELQTDLHGAGDLVDAHLRPRLGR
jgi:PAS domain S-box-containing protein